MPLLSVLCVMPPAPTKHLTGSLGGSWYSDRGYDGDDERESYETILLTSLSRIKR